MNTNGGQVVLVSKGLMLDVANYGHWKSKMVQAIRSIDEDAWTAVVKGWEEPTKVVEGVKVLKTPEEWTNAEKNASKFNSKALTAIFQSVELKQFEHIQGCKSAKKAWEVLQSLFEGDDDVKRTRIDQLATQFENIRWNNDETIGSFAGRLNKIANEAEVLGKTYKEKKLVKKFLRCMPSKYSAYKAALKVAKNTDEMKFAQVIGMLQSEEMEEDTEIPKHKGIALVADKYEDRFQQVEEKLSLLARNFGKVAKKNERRQGQYSNQKPDNSRYSKNDGTRNRSDNERFTKRKDAQCHACEGMCYFKSECPFNKIRELKCSECKGIGHTRQECPNLNKKGENSFLSFSESESEEDSSGDEQLLNYAAFITEDEEKVVVEDYSDSETEDEIDSKEEYKKLYDNWVELSQNVLQLTRDKIMLEAKVNILEMDISLHDKPATEYNGLETELKTEQAKNKELEWKYKRAQELWGLEEDKVRQLESVITENHKHVRMLTKGTQSLDKLLTMGQPSGTNWGLGYTGNTNDVNEAAIKLDNFVQSKSLLHEEKAILERHVSKAELNNTRVTKNLVVQKRKKNYPVAKRKRGCYYCEKQGHRRAQCYKFQEKLSLLWKKNKCYAEPKKSFCVWVTKKDLYGKDQSTEPREGYFQNLELHCNIAQINLEDFSEEGEEELICHIARENLTEEENLLSNVAFTTTQQQNSSDWYFDSGCSRHMTGDSEALNSISNIKGGTVTFGGGDKGRIHKTEQQLADIFTKPLDINSFLRLRQSLGVCEH